jgi:hypothetical protein
VREIAEGARDDHRLLAAQPVQDALEFGTRRDVLVAVKGDGALPHALDEIERRSAFLVPHGVAQQSAEQTDVIAQWALGLYYMVQGGLRPDFAASKGDLRDASQN